MSDFLHNVDIFRQTKETGMAEEEDLGKRLKLRRIALDITQKGLAQKASLDVSTLNAVENGRRPIDKLKGAQLVRLADVLGCTTDYLLGHTVEGGIPGA